MNIDNEKHLNAETNEAGNTFSTVASIYYVFYDIDLKNDSFIKHRAVPLVSDFTDKFSSAHDCLQGLAEAMFVPEDQEKVAGFYETDNWPVFLKDKDTVYQDARSNSSGWVRTNLIAAVRDENGIPLHVLVAIQKVDDEVVREAVRKAQMETQLK